MLVVVSLVLGSSVGEAQGAPQATGSGVDELVDVGGYRLRVRCAGEGTPTVLLEAGLGSNSATWDSVVPGVDEFTRVCRYDRPNLGRSDPSPREILEIGPTTFIALRSGQEVVTDLRRVLTSVGGDGPYVLVGHSLGGLFIVLFASLHPEDVAGIVLVDSAHPDQVARSHELMTFEEAQRDQNGLMQNREGLDIDRILDEVRSRNWRTIAPLVVLAHGQPDSSPEEEEDWRDMQADHARRSPSGRLVVAERSGHDIQLDQPDLVVEAIREVVTRARSGR